MKKKGRSPCGNLSVFSSKARKRGMSAVIATVLIILIVVVGVGIVWKVILPLFDELKFFGYGDLSLGIVIFDGYTIFDEDAGFAIVQVERGPDDVDLKGIEIGFNFGGETVTYQTETVPQPNGRYKYSFNFTADGVEGTPDKVTVAPVFVINGVLELGMILDEKPMPSGRITLSGPGWERASDGAAITILRIEGPGWNWDPNPKCIATGVEICGNDIDDDCNGDIDFADEDCLTTPVAYYKFDNNADDEVGNNHGVPYALSYADDLNRGTYADFQSIALVNIPDTSDINLMDIYERTYSIWFMADETVNRYVLYEEGGSGHGINIYISAGKLYAGFWSSEAEVQDTWLDTQFTDTAQWHHIGFVFDGSGRQELWLDGVKVDNSSVVGYVPSHGGDINLGYSDGALDYHDSGSSSAYNDYYGGIDDFKIYNVAVSPGEIIYLSNNPPAEGCVVSEEICDGEDNDCDGVSDNYETFYCGMDVGDCSIGTSVCFDGSAQNCVGSQGPWAETGNIAGADRNCDGVEDNAANDCMGTVVEFTPINAVANNEFSANFMATNAIDGDTGYWYTCWYSTSASWIYFDLGEKKCISGIKTDYFDSGRLPVIYTVQVSDDAVEWADVYGAEDLTDTSTSAATHSFNEVKGRYIRLYLSSGSHLEEFKALVR